MGKTKIETEKKKKEIGMSECCMKNRYRKRKESLKKKAMELSILCDIPVGLLCYGPNGEFDSWPENHTQLHQLIQTYHHHKNNNNGGGMKKSPEILKKNNEEEKGNWEIVVSGLGENGLLSESCLVNLLNDLDSKLEETYSRINFLMNNEQEQGKKMMMEEKIGESREFIPNLLEETYLRIDDGIGPEIPNWVVDEVANYQSPLSEIINNSCSSSNSEIYDQSCNNYNQIQQQQQQLFWSSSGDNDMAWPLLDHHHHEGEEEDNVPMPMPMQQLFWNNSDDNDMAWPVLDHHHHEGEEEDNVAMPIPMQQLFWNDSAACPFLDQIF